MKNLSFLLPSLLFTLVVACGHAAPLKDAIFRPRILDLKHPQWALTPGINPAIPQDYAMAEGPEDLVSPFVLWGRPEDAKVMAKHKGQDKPSLSAPVILAEISMSAVQTGPASFLGEGDLAALAENEPDVRKVSIRRLRWGVYPVLAAELEMANGDTCRMAWVGLNEPGGTTFLFYIPKGTYPADAKDAERTLWETFLKKTTQLDERQFFWAVSGQQLYEGQTLYEEAGRKITFEGEICPKTGNLAVKAQVLSPATTLKVERVEPCQIGTQWLYGADAVKIYATVQSSEKYNIISDSVFTVVLKSVPELSIQERSTADGRTQVFRRTV